MYDLHDYARMIADRARIDAYRRALEAAVQPGSVVVDIGAGTGILSVLACRLGARRVYAIEPNEAVSILRDLARDNGCADRVTVLQADALEVVLPERADVVIADLRGGTPLATGHLPVLAHARERFLAPGGVLVPTRDTLFAALVSSAAAYARAVGPADAAGVDLGAMRVRLAQSLHRDRARAIGAEELATPGVPWATIDYATVVPAPVSGRAAWTLPADATLHGVLLWFEAEMPGGVRLSTAPGGASVYPQIVLPLASPVAARAGDHAIVDLWAAAEGEAWGWNTVVTSPEGVPRGHHKQSTFLAQDDPPRAGGAGS